LIHFYKRILRKFLLFTLFDFEKKEYKT